MKSNNKQTDHILICIPTATGQVDWRFTSSLASMYRPCTVSFMWTHRTMINIARNMFVSEFLKDTKYTHLLMIDSDEIFAEDTLIKLYNHDVPVCCTPVYQRREPYSPCVYKMMKDGYHVFYPDNALREIDGFGTGFVLFKRDVFNNIEFPWFETYYDENKELWSVDLDFSKKLYEKNIPMYVDGSIDVRHIGENIIIDKSFAIDYLNQKNSKVKVYDKKTLENKLNGEDKSGIIK